MRSEKEVRQVLLGAYATAHERGMPPEVRDVVYADCDFSDATQAEVDDAVIFYKAEMARELAEATRTAPKRRVKK